jgi:hypothetical protein
MLDNLELDDYKSESDSSHIKKLCELHEELEDDLDTFIECMSQELYDLI